MTAARLAVGGLALAEITGGFNAIPAWACGNQEPVQHASTHRSRSHQNVQVQPVAQATRPVAAQPSTPAPQPDPAAAPDDLFGHYIVQPGDNLTYIAAAYGLPWESLWAINADQVSHPDRIFVGQRLRLPA